jgi:hypothetical protein
MAAIGFGVVLVDGFQNGDSMRANTMSKKRRIDNRIEQQPDVRTESVGFTDFEVKEIEETKVVLQITEDTSTIVETVTDAVAPRRFTPRPCSLCTAHRDGKNYSYVYHTAGRVRYCKCKLCNNTWTQSAELP